MGKSLKEIFGLREMSINVPDKDLPALRKTINAAVKAGQLPADAPAWLPASTRSAKGTPAPGVKAGAPQASTPAPAVPAGPATMSKTPGGWAAHKAKNPDAVNPARTTKPALDDPWFKDDVPELDPKSVRAEPPPIPKAALKKAKQPLAPHLPAPKSANVKMGKGSADFKPQTDWSKDAAISGEFPDLPAPQSANVDTQNSDDYKSPFGHISGGSSWDAMPAWARDPESMPRAGGGSMPIPGSQQSDLPKGKGPSPVGAQWTDKDVAKMNKKPGMLSRLFGKKKES